MSSVLSQILGWSSTIAWSISFYPQVFRNYQRASVTGISVDFIILNVVGFLCYSIFNSSLLFSERVRSEYRSRTGGDSLIQVNDLAFSLHALLLSLITFSQSFLIYKRDADQRLSNFNKFFLSGALLAVISTAGLIGFGNNLLQLLDLIYLLSSIKIYISFSKYLPQAVLNHRRQSTVGWEIGNIILDFTGSILSLCQLFLDAHLTDNWNLVLSPKLALSLLSISFDVVFLVQHFVLYRFSNELDTPSRSTQPIYNYGSIGQDTDTRD